jgi:hypothetical protein
MKAAFYADKQAFPAKLQETINLFQGLQVEKSVDRQKKKAIRRSFGRRTGQPKHNQ